MTTTVLSPGIIAYYNDLTELTTKYQKMLKAPDSSIANYAANLMENAYSKTLLHLIACDVALHTGIEVQGVNSNISTKNLKFSIDISNLSWNVTTTNGIQIDLVKIENEIAAQEDVVRNLQALSALTADGPTDLLDYAATSVGLIAALHVAAKFKLAEIQAIINEQAEAQAA